MERARFPTMDEMSTRTASSAARFPNLVELRRVGESRAGEPIEMISIGAGPRSVLVVGAPHPNEPVGCLTIERLVERLCSEPAFRSSFPYRWHFIKAIEPDALRLNQGWFDRPGDLAHYLEHFFRPALFSQAEYSFPFSPEVGVEVRSTPENAAYRTAMDLARPNLLMPLHNCDYGGVFYVMSHRVEALIPLLQRQPEAFGLRLNTCRESEGYRDGASYAPGIYATIDIPGIVRENSPVTTGDVQWTGGNSSFGYASEMGALSLIPEVPFWDTDDADDGEGPDASLALAQETLSWNREIIDLGASVIDRAKVSADIFAELVREAAEDVLRRAETRAANPGTPVLAAGIGGRAYQIAKVGRRIGTLRAIALIRRQALNNARAGRDVEACEAYLASGLAALASEFTLRAQPLGALVSTQLQAVLTAASWLGTR